MRDGRIAFERSPCIYSPHAGPSIKCHCTTIILLLCLSTPHSRNITFHNLSIGNVHIYVMFLRVAAVFEGAFSRAHLHILVRLGCISSNRLIVACRKRFVLRCDHLDTTCIPLHRYTATPWNYTHTSTSTYTRSVNTYM